MDEIQRVFYQSKFTLDVSTRNGMEYQRLFERIMASKYTGDFVKIEPWGSQGDWKADGYVRSTKTVYQVYAPHEMKLTNTLKKIEEDFSNALVKWKDDMREWTFVHNSTRGIPAPVLDKINELQKDNPKVSFSIQGPDALERMLFELDDVIIEEMYGFMPSKRDVTSVNYTNIKKVVANIARGLDLHDQVMNPVSSDKLNINNLSSSVRSLLTIGMAKSDAVNQYFSKHHDPQLGDEIANTFKAKYEELKTMRLEPDLIFAKLQEFTYGRWVTEPKDQVAALAILAYLFERCDIFENNGGE
ncbi:MAG: hypothetical protein AMDU1_APLC00104G0001 [Thermoplasmatales archaeon A-plasma]|nr:MAG: hypothetical protein AMDU1_APLC00104G0001 [Thermoplasmatales archaeon A-plasma]